MTCEIVHLSSAVVDLDDGMDPVGWLNTPEVEQMVITIDPADWEDLDAQFTAPLMLFLGGRCTVAVMADEWGDIQAQFPSARLAE